MATIVMVVTVFYVSIEKNAIVSAGYPLSNEDVESIRLLISRNKPAAIVSNSKVKLSLNNAEANKLLSFVNQYYEKNIRAKSVFENSRIKLKVAYELPANPIGRFINIKTVLKINHGKYFIVEEMKLGKLSIPSFILDFIQPIIVDGFKRYYGSYFVIWKQVKRIDIYNSVLNVHYQIERTDFNKLRRMARKVLVDEVMRERITVYAIEMDKLINRLAPIGPQSVTNLIALMFDFSEKRAIANGQVIEENRVALLTLAAYMVGKNPLSYITEDEIEARKKIKFTLKGRYDLAQHYLVSAGLSAIGNTTWSRAIGLEKELRDSDGESGFSFVDLMADMSGNKLAEAAFSSSTAALLQAKLKKISSEDEIMGNIDGLQENLNKNEFRMEFGNTSSEEYIRIIREIRRRVIACDAYRL